MVGVGSANDLFAFTELPIDVSLIHVPYQVRICKNGWMFFFNRSKRIVISFHVEVVFSFEFESGLVFYLAESDFRMSCSKTANGIIGRYAVFIGLCSSITGYSTHDPFKIVFFQCKFTCCCF